MRTQKTCAIVHECLANETLVALQRKNADFRGAALPIEQEARDHFQVEAATSAASVESNLRSSTVRYDRNTEHNASAHQAIVVRETSANECCIQRG